MAFDKGYCLCVRQSFWDLVGETLAYSRRISVLEQRVQGIDLAGLISRLGSLCLSSVGLVDLCNGSSLKALLQDGLKGDLGAQTVDRPL